MQYARGANKGILKPPKTKAGIREIYITDEVVNEIMTYKAWLSEYFLKFGKKITPDSPFIVSSNLSPLSEGAPRSRWATIIKRSGLKFRSVHTLRHTHASNLIACDINFKILQHRLGHSKYSTTLDLYGHLLHDKNRDHQKIALEKIQEMIEG